MNLTLQCPSCHKDLEVDSGWAGQQLDCPLCTNAFIVPSLPPPVAKVSQPLPNLAPPASEPVKIQLWNPNSAAAWCLLLGPAFGPLFHYLNWKTLGDEQRSRASLRWFIAALFLMVGSMVWGTFAPDSSGWGFFLVLLFLVLWILISARGQVAVVKEHYGNDYQHKSWVLPVILGIAAQLVLAGVTANAAEGVRQEMISMATVQIANEILSRSSVDPKIQCIKVKLDTMLGDGKYQGTAFYNTGGTTGILAQFQGDVYSAHIEPAELMALQLRQAANDGLMEAVNESMKR